MLLKLELKQLDWQVLVLTTILDGWVGGSHGRESKRDFR